VIKLGDAATNMIRMKPDRAAQLMFVISAICVLGGSANSAQSRPESRRGVPESVFARTIPTVLYCVKCHQEEFDEWRQSLHASSSHTLFYLTSANLLVVSQGGAASAHCDTCHSPVAVQSGTLIEGPHRDQASSQGGVTCMVCHSIVKLKSTSGDGSYVMGFPAVMVDANGNRVPGEVPYREILAHPDRHRQAVMKDFYRTSEFCAACHNATVPADLNNYKPIREFATYDEWQSSAFSRQDPLNFYPEKLATCQDCHMPSERLGAPAAEAYAPASHRWLAGNTAVPFYYGYDEQLQRTIQFLQSGRFLTLDIVGLEASGSGELIAPLGSVPFRLTPNQYVIISVVIRNKGIGHSLLPELRDLYEAWVDFRVMDSTGREIVHSGFLNSSGTLDPRAHVFLDRPLDKNGNPIENHEIWKMRSVGFDSTIAAGGATIVRYGFRIPADAKGPLLVTAQVKYRHFQQRYLNTVLGPDHRPYPVVVLATGTAALEIGENRPAPKGEDGPDWMRWNNLGIACLGPTGDSGFAPVPGEELQQAIAAFSEVVKLRPRYVDGYTNLALTYLQLGKFDAAEGQLRQALSLDAENARALYYMALVEKHSRHFDQEVEDLQKVASQYPRSRDARRELGLAFLAQGRDEEALGEFQALQQIVPDDLVAHQELASLYRKFGMPAKAAEEEAAFNAEKPDPAAPTYSFNFLREHPEVVTESLPWHVHHEEESEPTQPK